MIDTGIFRVVNLNRLQYGSSILAQSGYDMDPSLNVTLEEKKFFKPELDVKDTIWKKFC
jgi:hypothetical protein